MVWLDRAWRGEYRRRCRLRRYGHSPVLRPESAPGAIRRELLPRKEERECAPSPTARSRIGPPRHEARQKPTGFRAAQPDVRSLVGPKEAQTALPHADS